MKRRNPRGRSALTLTEALQLLGLDPSPSKAQVRSAYRAAAKQHHPDAGGDAKVFARVTEAYEILSGELEPAPEKARPAPPPRPSTRSVCPVVSGPDIISVLQQLQAIANLHAPSQYARVRVVVDARGGPYAASLLDLIVDVQNGRDILEGPACPPEPSIWDEE